MGIMDYSWHCEGYADIHKPFNILWMIQRQLGAIQFIVCQGIAVK